MKFLDLIFPENIKCVECGIETSKIGICDECLKKLSLIAGNTCDRCGASITHKGRVCIECKGRDFNFERNFAIFNYIDDVQAKVLAFKQNSVKAIGNMFAHFVLDKYKSIIEKYPVDIIIPVPISDGRRKVRKFNQSEVLCRELDGSKVINHILVREKETPHQTGLTRHNREENLKDCFKVIDKKIVKGKSILLIDDIYTTGSTLNACAEILKRGGAKSVICLTLARAVINSNRVVE